MRHYLLIVLIAYVPSACGDDGQPTPLPQDAAVITCSTSTCSGCCQGTECIKIPTTSACGLGGVTCATCTSGTTCKYGSCVEDTPLCNPAACPSGCCENGTCQTGGTDTACGSGGRACVNCQLLGGTCDNTRNCQAQTKTCSQFCTGCCMGESCLSGTSASACGASGAACTTCAPDQGCAGGSCQKTGQGTLYDVYLERVNIAAAAVATACLESECDPQVVLSVGGKKASSSIRAGNDVSFNEKLFSGVSEGDLLFRFEANLYDDDSPLFARWLCEASPLLNTTELAKGTLTFDCMFTAAAKLADLTFRFEKL